VYVSNGDGLHHDNLVISGFCHEVNANCTILGYYAAYSGNFLPTFQTTYSSHLQAPESKK